MTHKNLTTDKKHLTTQAYATEDHLSIRINTHERYTQPKQDFTSWILDLIPWNGNEIVLDAGCGAGLYITPIQERLTAGGCIISADLSFGDSASIPEEFGSVLSVGEALLGPYALLFELVSLPLLAAIVGAVLLGVGKKGVGA